MISGRYPYWMFLAFLHPAYLKAQNNPDLRFTHITTKDGLSSNFITCIFKDKRGFMWFGTDKGLNCYDGKRITLFTHDAGDSTTLPANHITGAAVDSENRFWIGTSNGLANFNPASGRSENFFHKPGNTSSLANNFSPNPFIDHAGSVWVATIDGVQLFNRRKNTFLTFRVPVDDKDPKKDFYNRFSKIMEDKRGRLWAASQYGINEIVSSAGKIQAYPTKMSTLGILEDRMQRIWMAQWANSLTLFSAEQKSFRQYQINADIIYCINEWTDETGNNLLCFGTNKGLIFSNESIASFRTCIPDNKNEFSLRGNQVYCLFRDEMNRLWVGTNDGINILDPYQQFFHNYWLNSGSNKVSDPDGIGLVRDILETEHGYIAGIWYRGGICDFDTFWNLRKRYFLPANRETGKSEELKSIYSIRKLHNDAEWYSTDSGLVRKYGNNCRVFVPPDAVSMERGDFQVREMIPENNDECWVRTPVSGIYKFNIKESRFVRHYRHIPGDSGTLADDNVNVIRYDPAGKFWAGTRKGLCEYNAINESFRTIVFKYKNPNDEAELNNISDLYAGSDHTLWVATHFGLIKMNTETKEYEILDKSSGIPEENLGKILADKGGTLWITSNAGLISFNPRKKSFRLFDAAFGVPVNNYSANAAFIINHLGRIVLGGEGVITEFDPFLLPVIKEPPQIEIFSLSSLGKEVPYTINGTRQKMVRLPAGTNQLTIQFSVLNYTSPAQNRFYYRLEGINPDWVKSPDGLINLTNLRPGKYQLRVTGSNNEGTINPGGDSLEIEVVPTFWQTNGFLAGLIIAMSLAAYALFKRRINSIRRAAGLKQRVAETEMMALRAQMNPHFIFNCLNSIDNLIQNDEKEKATTYLAKFAKLIRAILENSKTNVVPCWKDLETLKLYLELEAFRWGDNFTWQMHIDPKITQGDYKIPPMLIQPFAENAIHHGLLNKQSGDNKLLVEARIENNQIHFIIEDNGVGRKKAMEYKMINQSPHLSMGMDITSDRVSLFNQGKKGSIQITDLYNEYNHPAGTRVEIRIDNQS